MKKKGEGEGKKNYFMTFSGFPNRSNFTALAVASVLIWKPKRVVDLCIISDFPLRKTIATQEKKNSTKKTFFWIFYFLFFIILLKIIQNSIPLGFFLSPKKKKALFFLLTNTDTLIGLFLMWHVNMASFIHFFFLNPIFVLTKKSQRDFYYLSVWC